MLGADTRSDLHNLFSTYRIGSLRKAHLGHLLEPGNRQPVPQPRLLDLEVRKVALVACLIEAKSEAHDSKLRELARLAVTEKLLPHEDRIIRLKMYEVSA